MSPEKELPRDLALVCDLKAGKANAKKALLTFIEGKRYWFLTNTGHILSDDAQEKLVMLLTDSSLALRADAKEILLKYNKKHNLCVDAKLELVVMLKNPVCMTDAKEILSQTDFEYYSGNAIVKDLLKGTPCALDNFYKFYSSALDKAKVYESTDPKRLDTLFHTSCIFPGLIKPGWLAEAVKEVNRKKTRVLQENLTVEGLDIVAKLIDKLELRQIELIKTASSFVEEDNALSKHLEYWIENDVFVPKAEEFLVRQVEFPEMKKFIIKYIDRWGLYPGKTVLKELAMLGASEATKVLQYLIEHDKKLC